MYNIIKNSGENATYIYIYVPEFSLKVMCSDFSKEDLVGFLYQRGKSLIRYKHSRKGICESGKRQAYFIKTAKERKKILCFPSV